MKNSDNNESTIQSGGMAQSLEVLDATVDFEYFRGWLVEGLGYGDGSKGGRPPFDPVSMFKVLIVQAQHNLSDKRMEFMIQDRLSWTRSRRSRQAGPAPGAPPPESGGASDAPCSAQSRSAPQTP